jgi:hypothetical protein
MNMILESVLAFIGLVVGIFLAKFTKEEFKSGRKYFVLLCKVVLFVLIVYFLYLAEINLLILGFVLGVLVAYFFSNIYFYLGLGVFSSLNVYVTFLVFLFGLPYGTLIYHQKNLRKRILISLLLFFVPALILLVDVSTTLVFSFVAGALFMKFIRKL